MASAQKPAVMVNSCTGKMGRAVAEAATRAGLQVLPFTLCGAAEAQGGATIEVAGQKMELVGPATRDAVIEKLKQQHPNLVMVDYTVPGALRGVGSRVRASGRRRRARSPTVGARMHASRSALPPDC
jgi:4-hydroxy-tetrahydrodipicolinate reductase